MYDYGKCEICSTQLEESNIQQDFWIKEKLIVIENVPVGVCPRCGEKVVNAEVGEHIAELIRDRKQIDQAPTISVPLINYDVEAGMV
ncbi:YgiT-type zinc finger protein [candidate division KSB1 bacterium]|nr:YgiT-type zinc finger protein [candidate division KSB1 bacterium]MBL7093952.1 YgiT-type zinc finger protein [candidate division KSB1 bacterium]